MQKVLAGLLAIASGLLASQFAIAQGAKPESAARTASANVSPMTNDLSTKKKTTSTDQQTKRLENQADKDKDTRDANKSLKSAPKDERGDRQIPRGSKSPALH